jgi:hypothetical protein
MSRFVKLAMNLNAQELFEMEAGTGAVIGDTIGLQLHVDEVPPCQHIFVMFVDFLMFCLIIRLI